ncbi:MAG: 4Fe-4S dicluster domain-containing protein [Dehalococcoidia bacterium]|nr:4Fe-4S dicluster domain-containing protein [Dehalococcoidia bacterium]
MTGRLDFGIEPRDRRVPYLSPTERVKRLGPEREELYHRNQTPLAMSFMQSCALRASLADGPVSEDRQAVKDSVRLTLEIKDIALRLGADLVGVSLLDQSYLYLDQELPHSHTISLAQGMDYGIIKMAPSRKSYNEFWRAYNSLAEAAVHLAAHIRGMGYSARAHHVRTGDLLLVPGAVDAGLGELSKMGLLMTRQHGPRVRLAAVTTDLPVDTDRPQDLGMQDFCEKCSKCVRHCPSGAIPEKKSWVRGVRKWQVDAERCIDTFSKSFACGMCIRYCPWNKPDTALHRLAREAAVRYPAARSLLVQADDWLYGR